ncbi:carbon-nitrogen hydrolase family protein [Alicyclobacillaceae bacterium I2511]|nr:carbon-nitrogen hydrolase family protein [Alicyclobacillaceae bacterium I2511]
MTFRMVLAQLESSEHKQVNLVQAQHAVAVAKNTHGADLVVFPEIFMNQFAQQANPQWVWQEAESLDGPFVTGMASLARQHGVWLIFGMREVPGISDGDERGLVNFPPPVEAEDLRVFNTTVVVDATGEVVAHYRKTHLYDAFGGRESEQYLVGDALFQPITTPFGRLGLFVCYELRFPEIARHQAGLGAEVLIVPAAWVRGPRKEHHWQTLVTARALENTVFVAACNQAGHVYTGGSMVVDPMGIPLVHGPETAALIPCEIDLERIEAVRAKLPSYRHRRPELYGQG